jgi:hypothetical protein
MPLFFAIRDFRTLPEPAIHPLKIAASRADRRTHD